MWVIAPDVSLVLLLLYPRDSDSVMCFTHTEGVTIVHGKFRPGKALEGIKASGLALNKKLTKAMNGIKVNRSRVTNIPVKSDLIKRQVTAPGPQFKDLSEESKVLAEKLARNFSQSLEELDREKVREFFERYEFHFGERLSMSLRDEILKVENGKLLDDIKQNALYDCTESELNPDYLDDMKAARDHMIRYREQLDVRSETEPDR